MKQAFMKTLLLVVVLVVHSSTTSSSSPTNFDSLLQQENGVLLLPPDIVDARTVTSIDEWLLSNQDVLPSYSVRRPRHRKHVLLLPSDSHGRVAAAIGAIVRRLGL